MPTLGPDMKVLGVNGRPQSPHSLRAAITADSSSTASVRLSVQDGVRKFQADAPSHDDLLHLVGFNFRTVLANTLEREFVHGEDSELREPHQELVMGAAVVLTRTHLIHPLRVRM